MPRYQQVVRQWKLIRRLEQAPGGLSVAELSAEQEVSRRNTYRDLEALQEAGFPLYQDQIDGEHRWCLNCEQALRLLWCSPPVGLLCDYVAAWMQAVLVRNPTLDNASSADVWKALPDHVCGDGCTGISHAQETPASDLLSAGVVGDSKVEAQKQDTSFFPA